MSVGNHWSEGLLSTMKDRSNHVIASNLSVVIKDKYPKAKYHFLVLPFENIPSIYHLTSKHVKILEDIQILGQNVVDTVEESKEKFLFGYHASPSMQQLHMHVISTDFRSPFLKTKYHWNSFTTKFLISPSDVCDEVKRNGCFRKPPLDVIEQWVKTPLVCHKCEYQPKNMPDLKRHITNHL